MKMPLTMLLPIFSEDEETHRRAIAKLDGILDKYLARKATTVKICNVCGSTTERDGVIVFGVRRGIECGCTDCANITYFPDKEQISKAIADIDKERAELSKSTRVLIFIEDVPCRKDIPDKIRHEIWKRDGPFCQVCGLQIPKKCYHCGHIVDKFYDGSNEPENLVVMDGFCNQRKPLHDTRKQYGEWLRSGYWVTDWVRELRADMGIDGLPSDVISELIPGFIGTPRERVTQYLRQDIRYYQMQQLGLIYQAPHISKWAERWNTDECPEWKRH